MLILNITLSSQKRFHSKVFSEMASEAGRSDSARHPF